MSNEAVSTIQTASLTVTADEVIIGKKEQEPTDEEKSRYRWNAFLFAVATVMLTWWFTAHMEPFVTQVVLIGGVALFAIAQWVLSLTNLFGDKDELRKKFLAQRTTRVYLILAIIVAAGLIVTTKSLYVKLGVTDARRVVVQVEEVLARNAKGEPTKIRPFQEPLYLDEMHRTAGRPFFSLMPKDLLLVATEPKGYLPLPVALGFGGTRSPTFPFEAKRYHLLRVLPSIALKQGLADTDDPPDTIEVTVDGIKYRPVNDYHRHDLVYLGALKDEMSSVVTKHWDEFEKEYIRRLRGANTFDNTAVNSHLAELGKVVHWIETPDPKRSVEITIRHGDMAYTTRHTMLADAPEIESIYVEKPQ